MKEKGTSLNRIWLSNKTSEITIDRKVAHKKLRKKARTTKLNKKGSFYTLLSNPSTLTKIYS